MNVICAGLPKSGVHTVHKMFGSYRTVHDLYHEQFIDAIMSGNAARVDKLLARKRQSLALELDASTINGYVIDRVMQFDDVKVILTVRDYYAWANHFLQQCYHSRDDHWRLFWDWVFSTHDMNFPKEERVLEAMDLYPLSNYARHWAEYNQRVIDTVPEDRLLIVKFTEINVEMPRIAEFCGVPQSRLRKGEEGDGTVSNFFSNIDFKHVSEVFSPWCKRLRDKLCF